jgi:predicted nucleic acid-binding protein
LGGGAVDNLVFLDASPLGILAHPRPRPEVKRWLYGLLNRGVLVGMPEIADYEVRRELIRSKKKRSVQRLDELKKLMQYVPISTVAMLKAAELWAEARTQGKPTADHHALDSDVILAAQALTYANGREVIVATDNVSHLQRFVRSQVWHTVH